MSKIDELTAAPVAERKAMPVEELALDACGQPGGPSADEQARVDAEQLQLIEDIKRARAAGAEAERATGTDVDSKIERAQQRATQVAQLPDVVAALQVQVAALAAKVEEMSKS